MPRKAISPQPQKKSSRLRKTEPSPQAPRHLPPLNSLRAFNAAARRQSFAAAAAELGISPAAISRQVRILEETVGEAMFARNAHGVTLTRAGEKWLAASERAFGLLASALPGQAMPGRLSLIVSASFYLRWLLPRHLRLLADLPRAKVDVTIASGNITSGNQPAQADADLEIRFHRRSFGPGAQPAWEASSECIFADESILVAAPSLLGRAKVPLPPSALRRLPLILNTPDGWDWQSLAAARGLGDLPLGRALRCDLDDSAIQVALAGLGVALVERRFVADDLAAGRLVQPFDLAPLSLGEYRLHWRPALGRRAALLALRARLKEAVGPAL